MMETKMLADDDGQIDGDTQEAERAKKQRCAVITLLCFINLLANSAYSSIAPFFPKEAQAKGLPISSIGFIFSGYSISMCIFSPMFNHMMNWIGRKRVLILGCLCESFAMFCFGVFVLVKSPVAYGVLSCLCRCIEGFGNGCLNSATSSFIQFNYPDNASNLIGLTQTFTGLGMLMGPILGSVLYDAGGFMLPFFFCGALLFLLTIPICCVLAEKRGRVAHEEKKTPERASTPVTSRRGQVDTGFFAVLRKFPVLAGGFCMACSLMCLTFKEPILELRLLESGLSTWMIGIVFSLDTLTYTLTSVVLNFVPETAKDYQRLLAAGTLFFVVAMLLSGPCPGLPDAVWLICVGILVGGIGGALINNNVVPSLNQIVKGDDPITDTATRDELTNAISAISTGFFGLGSILGPILASVLSDLLTFRLSFAIVSVPVVLTSILQWVAVCTNKADRDYQSSQDYQSLMQ